MKAFDLLVDFTLPEEAVSTQDFEATDVSSFFTCIAVATS